MKVEHRLRENRDFRRVFNRGRSSATDKLVLYWARNRGSNFRVGFSVSRKVGNAVQRNLIKRRLRACFDRFLPELLGKPADFVVVCRKNASQATYQQLENDVLRLLKRAKFMI
ncbi:ribonuclease P protein component [Alicyclobacillaceae bacterium I2511]|nr:ribonuclease P protein component [Alicyclobacillaceae bacterium I2511]